MRQPLPSPYDRRPAQRPCPETGAGSGTGGFVYRRLKGSQRVYRHSDGRRVVIHYHHGGDTLPIGTLAQVVRATRWIEADLRRLGLIR
ncbi:MAG: type II toxin-antitoxin system HicA family toxin [Candidatus Rokuibacteriota bacterium]